MSHTPADRKAERQHKKQKHREDRALADQMRAQMQHRPSMLPPPGPVYPQYTPPSPMQYGYPQPGYYMPGYHLQGPPVPPFNAMPYQMHTPQSPFMFQQPMPLYGPQGAQMGGQAPQLQQPAYGPQSGAMIYHPPPFHTLPHSASTDGAIFEDDSVSADGRPKKSRRTAGSFTSDNSSTTLPLARRKSGENSRPQRRPVTPVREDEEEISEAENLDPRRPLRSAQSTPSQRRPQDDFELLSSSPSPLDKPDSEDFALTGGDYALFKEFKTDEYELKSGKVVCKEHWACPLCLDLKRPYNARGSLIRHYRESHLPKDQKPDAKEKAFLEICKQDIVISLGWPFLGSLRLVQRTIQTFHRRGLDTVLEEARGRYRRIPPPKDLRQGMQDADLEDEYYYEIRRAVFFDEDFRKTQVVPKVKRLLKQFDSDLPDWNVNDRPFAKACSSTTTCWPLHCVDSSNAANLNDYPKKPNMLMQLEYRPRGWEHGVSVKLKLHLWVLLAINEVSLDAWMGYAFGTCNVSHTCVIHECIIPGHYFIENNIHNQGRKMCFNDVSSSGMVSTENIWCERHSKGKACRVYLKHLALKDHLGVPEFTPTVVYTDDELQIKTASDEDVECGWVDCDFTTTSPRGLLEHLFDEHSYYGMTRNAVDEEDVPFVDKEETVKYEVLS